MSRLFFEALRRCKSYLKVALKKSSQGGRSEKPFSGTYAKSRANILSWILFFVATETRQFLFFTSLSSCQLLSGREGLKYLLKIASKSFCNKKNFILLKILDILRGEWVVFFLTKSIIYPIFLNLSLFDYICYCYFLNPSFGCGGILQEIRQGKGKIIGFMIIHDNSRSGDLSPSSCGSWK